MHVVTDGVNVYDILHNMHNHCAALLVYCVTHTMAQHYIIVLETWQYACMTIMVHEHSPHLYIYLQILIIICHIKLSRLLFIMPNVYSEN